MDEFVLETNRLVIRNWIEKDRDLFYQINSDDAVMEFFPFRRDRTAANKMMDELKVSIKDNGYGFTAVALKETNEVLGFCGLSELTADDVFPHNTMEIGWRLAPQFWGKGYITEAAVKLLQFGFETLQLPEIISFAVHNNLRSLAVMKRIGMIRTPHLDFDHPRVPDTHPHLKRHLVYKMTAEEFIQN
ncbi:MAG: GNAT family N-acetyltransferase [Pseudomonadota bacterium]